jgi:hypothetical protein
MEHISVTETEHYAADVEYLEQLCSYIIRASHDAIIQELINHLLWSGERASAIDIPAVLDNCREIIRRDYPLIIASIYDFDKAVNELSNITSIIEHQQADPMREFFRTIYTSYNECYKKTLNRSYTVQHWRAENLEMYNKLLTMCKKLRDEPRCIIEGMGDVVYI